MQDYDGWADHYLPHTGNPILDAAVIIAVGAVIVVVGLFMLWVKVKPWLEEIKADTKVVREHTENSHADAPNPNLRDDLDAKHHRLERNFAELRKRQDVQATQVVNLSENVKDVASLVREIKRDIGGIREEVRADRKATRMLGEKLDAHIEEKKDYGPRISTLEHELIDHRKAMEDPE